jgi:hypothetical protein
VAIEARNRFGGGTVIAGHQLTPFFGVELSGDFG